MYNAQLCIEHGVSEEEFLNTVVEFYDNDCTEAYLKASGSGNVKMVNISIRRKELLSYIMDTLPKYFENNSDIPSDFKEQLEQSDSMPSDKVENSEDNSEEVTSDEAPAKSYVLFKISTSINNQEVENAYEVETTDSEYLDSVGYDIAKANVEALGVEDEEQLYSDWMILDKTREEVIEEYGEVLNV